MHTSIPIRVHEHGAVSPMLRSILLLTGARRRRKSLPDFGAPRGVGKRDGAERTDLSGTHSR